MVPVLLLAWSIGWFVSTLHLLLLLQTTLNPKLFTTISGGYLGYSNDEERSETRY